MKTFLHLSSCGVIGIFCWLAQKHHGLPAALGVAVGGLYVIVAQWYEGRLDAMKEEK